MSTTDTPTGINYDELVTKSLLPQLRNAKDYNDQEGITEFVDKIEKALVHCSGQVVQLCAKEGLYANGVPVDVGQRDLSR